MTGSGEELVQRDDEHTPGPLEIAHRSVDEARTEVKRRLWFTPVAVLIVALIGFILGDWIYVALLGGLLGFGVIRLLRELKDPHFYLSVPPSQLADRVLEHRKFWQTRGRELRDTEQLVQVQDLLDGLSLGESWFRRNHYRIGTWSGILGAALWVVIAVVMLLAGEGLGSILAPLGLASLFGACAVFGARAESKRREAVELLEEVREEIAAKTSSLPAEPDQQIERAKQEKS